MYKLDQIRDIHLEITSKCQARCPMCPRRINGGPLNPLMTLNEINLLSFKQWFSKEFLQQLDSLFMCGNLGDPIIAKDCLEIFQYIREVNPSIRLGMHTNGSARDVAWWKELAMINVRTVFGIDGLEDTHHLYRISTDWKKIIENARAFINAGGYAEWHMLVFEHNQHQIDECRQISETMKFKNFQLKYTNRFDKGKFHVLNDGGKTVNILYPAQKSKDMIKKTLQYVSNPNVEIKCKAVQYKQIYISATGNVTPCCWLDMEYKFHKLDNRIDYMDKIDQFLNLHSNTLEEIFSSGYFKKIESLWGTDPLLECSKQCGIFDKLGSQFEKNND